MYIEKGKMPKGLSYPLRSSVLASSLDAACINVKVHLIYNAGNTFFEAFYWLPNENVDYDRFYIRTGSVASQNASKAKAHMESIVIPNFIKWANYILSLPGDSPILQAKPYFVKEF